MTSTRSLALFNGSSCVVVVGWLVTATVTTQDPQGLYDTTNEEWGLTYWPPPGTATWPPVGTFPWPRTWLPESVIACHATILEGASAVTRCSPKAQLGIAVGIMLVRVSKSGVMLPGRRLLDLEAEVWPVTGYTRSQASPLDGQMISITVGRGREQTYFSTDYAGTS